MGATASADTVDGGTFGLHGGEGMVGRLAASIVSGAGLEAVASTVDGYIERAKRQH